VDFLHSIDVGTVAIQFVVLLFSLSIHEASHAWMADRLGDYTARYLGRVTLNPIAHIDPIGTILFPLLQLFTPLPLIGWAKPVPVNGAHLKNPRHDHMLISLAGPGANLIAGVGAFIFLAVLKISSPVANGLLINMTQTGRIPGHTSMLAPVVGILFFVLVINIALALFNCIPIPPLDGHWVLSGVLPRGAADFLQKIGSYGFIVLYGLMFLGLFSVIFAPINWIFVILLSI
jgi:Zn-dependent protease